MISCWQDSHALWVPAQAQLCNQSIFQYVRDIQLKAEASGVPVLRLCCGRFSAESKAERMRPPEPVAGAGALEAPGSPRLRLRGLGSLRLFSSLLFSSLPFSSLLHKEMAASDTRGSLADGWQEEASAQSGTQDLTSASDPAPEAWPLCFVVLLKLTA